MSKLLIGVAFAIIWGNAAFASPISPYYLSSGNSIVVLQGDSFRSFPTSGNVIAVSHGTIRTMVGERGGGIGGVYTLAGVPTGDWYFTPYVGLRSAFDGTTDGIAYNYFADHETRTVYRTDLRWQDAELLFTVPCPSGPYDGDCHHVSAIAYDQIHRTLWVSLLNCFCTPRVLAEYTLDGQTLLKSVTVDLGESAELTALAFDPADQTLWGHLLDQNALVQFSMDGALLQYIDTSEDPYRPPTIPGLNLRGFESGEFRIAPEPASFAIVALGLTLLAAIGRRSSQRYSNSRSV